MLAGDVTFAEVGVPDFMVTSWAAYVMPIATALAIVDKLATAQKENAAEASTQYPVFGCRGASFLEHRGRGRGFRRQGNGHVARGGAPLRSDAAVTMSAFACSPSSTLSASRAHARHPPASAATAADARLYRQSIALSACQGSVPANADRPAAWSTVRDVSVP
jgi:hypothetical protein